MAAAANPGFSISSAPTEGVYVNNSTPYTAKQVVVSPSGDVQVVAIPDPTTKKKAVATAATPAAAANMTVLITNQTLKAIGALPALGTRQWNAHRQRNGAVPRARSRGRVRCDVRPASGRVQCYSPGATAPWCVELCGKRHHDGPVRPRLVRCGRVLRAHVRTVHANCHTYHMTPLTGAVAEPVAVHVHGH